MLIPITETGCACLRNAAHTQDPSSFDSNAAPPWMATRCM